MERYRVFIEAGCCALAAGSIIAVMVGSKPTQCEITLRDWDAHQEALMDCREDPDCYLTPADLERVRELAPQVQACDPEGAE